MLNTENLAVYLIFTLVIVIALFNLIGALIMMILDKKGNLKTLLNLGTDIKDLRKIFLLQGTLLSVFGGIIGLILGELVEGTLRQSLVIFDGNWLMFLSRPIVVTFFILLLRKKNIFYYLRIYEFSVQI